MGQTTNETSEQYEYFIVKRRKRQRPGVRPREERPMEVWERAVLDVFADNEVRGQMLWEAGRVKLDRLKQTMQKVEVPSLPAVMDELWAKLSRQCDEAAENRPYEQIDAERARRSEKVAQEIAALRAQGAEFAAQCQSGAKTGRVLE